MSIPSVDFNETTPHILAGIRRLPARSLPVPKAQPPAASRAHSPPEEPPGVLQKLNAKWFAFEESVGLQQRSVKTSNDVVFCRSRVKAEKKLWKASRYEVGWI